MRRPVVIIFARAPRLGAVKRRLAAGIGARGALRFYRAMLSATAWPIARDRRWHTLLAITPRGARADWARLAPPGTPRMAQVSGDLGQRMEKALARYPRAILIGSDIPGLRPADIAAGFRALGRADAVFGPALDGGYWLVGFGPRRPHRPFAHVRWSSRHALADTLANFRRHRVVLLPPKRDVDSAEDLAALLDNHAEPRENTVLTAHYSERRKASNRHFPPVAYSSSQIETTSTRSADNQALLGPCR